MKDAVKSAAQRFEKLQVLSANVVILDPQGTIVTVNRAWRDFGRRNGLLLENSGVGLKYLDYCDSGNPDSSQLITDLSALLAGQLDLLTLVYPCHSPDRARWFFLSGVPLSLQEPAGVALVHTNLTEVLRATANPGKKTSPRMSTGPAISLDTIGATLEHSISQQLASQLTVALGQSGSAKSRARGSRKLLAAQKVADAQLSRRQLHILALLTRGKTNAEIAKIILRSPNTVKLHVSAILKQLDCRNRTQAALLASNLLDSNLRSDHEPL
jgi:DNA-binding CsgD family transcriptional regulator